MAQQDLEAPSLRQHGDIASLGPPSYTASNPALSLRSSPSITTSSPPTYASAELMTLEIQAQSIVIANTNEVLFELSQAPESGAGSAFSIERVVYKAGSDGIQTRIRSRKSPLYNVKDMLFTHPQMKPRNVLELQPEGGARSCLKGPAVVVKGRPFPLFPCVNRGSSWHIASLGASKAFVSSFKRNGRRKFCDENGKVIAYTKPVDPIHSRNPSTSPPPSLETVVPLDEKTLNALVTLWCAAIWFEARKIQQLKNAYAYDKFAPNYTKTKSKRPIRLYGSNIPAALQ